MLNAWCNHIYGVLALLNIDLPIMCRQQKEYIIKLSEKLTMAKEKGKLTWSSLHFLLPSAHWISLSSSPLPPLLCSLLPCSPLPCSGQLWLQPETGGGATGAADGEVPAAGGRQGGRRGVRPLHHGGRHQQHPGEGLEGGCISQLCCAVLWRCR